EVPPADSAERVRGGHRVEVADRGVRVRAGGRVEPGEAQAAAGRVMVDRRPDSAVGGDREIAGGAQVRRAAVVGPVGELVECAGEGRRVDLDQPGRLVAAGEVVGGDVDLAA